MTIYWNTIVVLYCGGLFFHFTQFIILENFTILNLALSGVWETIGGSVVSASDLGPEGREFEPGPVHPRCVLRQNT